METGSVFLKALERMGFSEQDLASGAVERTIELTDLDHARRQLGGDTPPLAADHPLVAAALPGEGEEVDEGDHATLGRLAAFYVYAGVELPPGVKAKVNRAFFPYRLTLRAEDELYVKKGEQKVIDSVGPRLIKQLTIEDGGHLVVPNTAQITVYHLVKAKGA